MRRPQVPLLDGAPQSRRIRDSIRDMIAWLDAGTRTTDLPTLTLSDDDFMEFVRPDGTRYKATVGALRTHLGL